MDRGGNIHIPCAVFQVHEIQGRVDQLCPFNRLRLHLCCGDVVQSLCKEGFSDAEVVLLLLQLFIPAKPGECEDRDNVNSANHCIGTRVQ